MIDVEVLEVEGRPESVPVVRRFVHAQLVSWGMTDVADDAELVVSELVGNVVLHAPGPATVALVHEVGTLRISVADSSAALPVRRDVPASGLTGRGLQLVQSVARSWGVAPRDDERPGKVVWAVVEAGPRLEVSHDLDVDALLAGVDDDTAVGGLAVTIGEAPTALLAAAKDQLDGVLRELALASEGGGPHGLPAEVVASIREAVQRFSEARAQLRALLAGALSRGEERVALRFVLSAELAEAGEDYLQALAAADAFARDSRLLTLESPVEYRVLRAWYVEGLVTALRAVAAGRVPERGPTFEERLLVALGELEARDRANELGAKLQRVTARLAAADSAAEIADIAVREGTSSLAAPGGSLFRLDGVVVTPLSLTGNDVIPDRRYRELLPAIEGPGNQLLRQGGAVWVETTAQRDEGFPQLVDVQPDVLGVAVLPLLVAGELVGVLRLSFDRPHAFSTGERDYLGGLAALTAQAIARADASALSRSSEQRTRVLAGLGERLASAVSVAGVVDAVADVVLAGLGDWTTLHLVDERGLIWCPLARHRDPALTARMTAFFARFQVSTDQPYGPGHVIATGRRQELDVTDEEAIAALAGDEALADSAREVQLRSGVTVPLITRGRTVGALAVGRSWEGPMLPVEVELLENIGRLAALTVDNALAIANSVRLDLALTAADVGSFDLHLDSGQLLWDDRMYRMFDVDPSAFDGTLSGYLAAVLPEDAPTVRAAVDNAVSTVGELSAAYRIRLGDGKVRWVEARGRALAGSDGRAERLVGIAVDITEQRDASARAERTLELMADAFLAVDQQARFTYVNREAERVLQRGRHELLGRYVWDEFAEFVGPMSHAMYERAVRTALPVRAEEFFAPLETHFEVRAFPTPEGLSIYFTDIGARRTTELQRDLALERLSLLNAIGEALTTTLDVNVALARLADLLVPSLADLVSLDLRDHHGSRAASGVVISAADPAKAAALRAVEEQRPRSSDPASAVNRVLRGEPLVHLTGPVDETPDDAAARALHRALDMRHTVVVPLAARGRVFGALSLIRTGPEALPWTSEDAHFALEVGRRASLMVDNAAQFTAQRSVAEELQRSLLPELPGVSGVVLGASYEPSSSDALVGGDWYDAFVLPDGALGLVVGDVMGHDIAAAAAMGQLRSVLRSCAADGDPPARVLDRLDRLVSSFAMADLATVVYARLDQGRAGGVLSWANAGHPPPLLIRPDGTADFLDGGASPMIGAPFDEVRGQTSEPLAPGSLVLMYTDGLVERRGTDLDDQLELLRRSALAAWHDDHDPETLCRRLISAVRRDAHSDDAAAVALLLK